MNGWKLPDGSPAPTTPAGWKALRLANGRQNKTCADCGAQAHPVRTECSLCGGDLVTPAAALPEGGAR